MKNYINARLKTWMSVHGTPESCNRPWKSYEMSRKQKMWFRVVQMYVRERNLRTRRPCIYVPVCVRHLPSSCFNSQRASGEKWINSSVYTVEQWLMKEINELCICMCEFVSDHSLLCSWLRVPLYICMLLTDLFCFRYKVMESCNILADPVSSLLPTTDQSLKTITLWRYSCMESWRKRAPKDIMYSSWTNCLLSPPRYERWRHDGLC